MFKSYVLRTREAVSRFRFRIRFRYRFRFRWVLPFSPSTEVIINMLQWLVEGKGDGRLYPQPPERNETAKPFSTRDIPFLA